MDGPSSGEGHGGWPLDSGNAGRGLLTQGGSVLPQSSGGREERCVTSEIEEKRD